MSVQFSQVHSMKDEPSKKMVTFSNFCLRANMSALPQKRPLPARPSSGRILDDSATLWLYDGPIAGAASERLSLTKRHKTSRLRDRSVFCAVERPHSPL